MSELLLDAAGRRRSAATMPGFHAGRPPRNKGMRYPADPPTIEEVVAVMRHAGEGIRGRRPRGLIGVLWRVGLPVPEGLGPAAGGEPGPRAGGLDGGVGGCGPRDPRGTGAGGGRLGRAPRFAPRAGGGGRPPPRGRHGRLGRGAARALAPGPPRAAGRTTVL